jgi:tetratricopeptide (TPR) repeat protein
VYNGGVASSPITVRLRCASWEQLEAIHRRDLSRGALFLRSANRPPIDTPISVHLSLPSGTLIILAGAIHAHVPEGGLGGRGPGVEIALEAIPASTMWLIESALKAHRQAGASPAGRGEDRNSASDEPAPPSIEAGAPVADAEDELVSALEEELQALRRMNPFQVLGLAPDAGDQDVRNAFAALSKRYHPDKYARYDSRAARDLAAEIFILIRDACRALHAGPARELASAAVGGTGTQRKVAPPPDAERTSPAPPASAAEPGSTAAPQGEEITTPSATRHARANALLDEGRYDEALTLFGLAARRDPHDRDAVLGVELAEGLKALAARDRLEAAQRFEAVLELDPDNERAARGLTEIRRQATEERKHFLSRLLGDKE